MLWRTESFMLDFFDHDDIICEVGCFQFEYDYLLNGTDTFFCNKLPIDAFISLM